MILNKKQILGIFFVSLFVFMTISANSQTKPSSDEFIFLTTTGEPDSVDPAVTYETRGGGIMQQVYDTLLAYDGKSTSLVPSLASEMPEVSADAKVFTYKLREDVFFTDGTQFDAYIMKYSIDRAIIMNDPDGPAWMIAQAIAGAADYAFADEQNHSSALTYLAAGGVTVVDQFTVKFTLDSPYVAFLAAMTYSVGAAVSPKAVIDNAPSEWATSANATTLAEIFPDSANRPSWFGDFTSSGVIAQTDIARHPWMDSHAVGTGPYKLIAIRTGEGVDFERNDDWWASEAGLKDAPAFKTVHSNIVAETQTRLLAMQNEEADGSYVPATSMPDVYDLDTETVKDAYSNVQVNTYPSFSVMYFGFNMNDTLPQSVVGTAGTSTYDEAKAATLDAWGPKNPDTSKANAGNPFTALKFRQAFANSFDYTAFINTALNGFGERMEGFIPRGMLGHQTGLDLPDKNLVAAKTLFEEVGWEGDLTISYNSGNDVRKAGSELLKDAINGMEVGITITVAELEWDSYLDMIRGKQLPIYFIGWAPDYADPDNYADPFVGSAGTLAKRQSYQNTDVDGWIGEAKEETDETARVALYKLIEEAASADVGVIFGYQALGYKVDQDYVNGIDEYSSNPMASARMYSELTKSSTGGVPGFELFFVISTILVIAVIRRKY